MHNGGKLPPQDIILEEAVLGAILIDSNIMSQVAILLQPSAFYKDAHARIYTAMMTLYSSSSPIDLLTVHNQLSQSNELDTIGGTHYLSQLTNGIASSANTEYHCLILKEKQLKRSLIKISSNAMTAAYDTGSDVFELINQVQQDISQALKSHIKENAKHISLPIGQLIKDFDDRKDGEQAFNGLTSGLYSVDKITGGWQNSNLIVLAARPGMGKTALALNIAQAVALEEDKTVLVFSLEMSAKQIAGRYVSMNAKIDNTTIASGFIGDSEFVKINKGISKIASAKIYIDDTPGLSCSDMRTKAINFNAKNDIGMIIVDYMQLMSGSKRTASNREQEISEISRTLKLISRELNIPVIALSQLSRAVESRGGDKRPILSDLRESGSIEQDADIVAFLYRPEYYGITENADGDELPSGFTEIIFSKNRGGSLNSALSIFNGKYQTFKDFNPQTFYQ